MHYGKEKPLGARTRIRYDWNNETDFRTVDFESIIAENPTFSKNGSGPWIVGRNQSDMYSAQLFNAPTLKIEGSPVGARARHGIAGRIKGSFKDKAGENSGYLLGEAGYTFKGDRGIQPNLTGFYRRDVSEKGDRDYVGASALLFAPFKRICFEATYQHPISGGDKPKTYFGLSWVKRF